jgi:glutamine amidotransferase
VIAIVDYDMGNVASVANMLKRIGARDAFLTRDAEVLGRATSIILPGVGAFDNGMRNLRNFGLLDALNEAVLVRRVPLLGICLGMQLLTDSSEEGQLPGLGYLRATTRRFRFPRGSALKIPHMGWNYIESVHPNPIIPEDSPNRFYFVHSYYVDCADPADVIATADYGFSFPGAVQRDNVFGVQFHPEKSHRYGMKLLEKFVAFQQCRSSA